MHLIIACAQRTWYNVDHNTCRESTPKAKYTINFENIMIVVLEKLIVYSIIVSVKEISAWDIRKKSSKRRLKNV